MDVASQRERPRVRAWFNAGGWAGVWHTAYLATLAAATGVAASDGSRAAGFRAGVVGLAMLNGAWYLLIVRWRYWQAPQVRFAGLLGVAAALWVPLLRAHPAFGLTVFAAYGVAACPWLRRAAPTVVALTALVAVVDHTDGTALTLAEMARLAAIGTLVLLAHATVGAVARESEGRRALIAELEAARADLAVRERQAGVLEERQRVAREIHDGLAQGFASIVTLLEAADARLPAGAADARASLDQARQAARDGLGEARRLVWALRPDQADPPGGLMAALERLAERGRAPGRTAVEVVTTGPPADLNAATALAVLRTAQEALANATRHARATTITVTLSWLGDHVILDVADDGRGFDPTARGARSGPEGGGFGLTSLRERADAVGGVLEVDAAPGEGTVVSLRVPTAPRAAHPRASRLRP